MASYHLSVKPVSRADGRSATAAAAYRAAARIACTRQARVHDYTRRAGVLHAEIVLPVGAIAHDRQALWNAAEAAEKRKDGRVAREFEIALPAELAPAQRLALAKQLAEEIIARHGCAVDIAIHAPGKGDDRNHHAHLLTTTRRLGPEGLGAKCRELDDHKTGPAEIEHWRQRWADLQNRALEQAGAQDRVTHLARTPTEIEAGYEPTAHIGSSASELERGGVATERGDINRAVVARNQERKTLWTLIAEREGQIRLLDRQEDRLGLESTTATALLPTRQAEPASKPRKAISDYTLPELQGVLQIEGQALQQARRQRLHTLAEKAQAREQRRAGALAAQKQQRPQLPAGFRNAQLQAFQGQLQQWSVIAKQLERLLDQAQALRERLRLALAQLKAWTVEQLRKRYPEAMARIEGAHPAGRQTPPAAEAMEAAEATKTTPATPQLTSPPAPATRFAPTPGVPRAGHQDQDARIRQLLAGELARLARTEAERMAGGGSRRPRDAVYDAAARYWALRPQHGVDEAEQQLAAQLAAEVVRQIEERAKGAGGATSSAPTPKQALLVRYVQEIHRAPETGVEPAKNVEPRKDQEQDLDR